MDEELEIDIDAGGELRSGGQKICVPFCSILSCAASPSTTGDTSKQSYEVQAFTTGGKPHYIYFMSVGCQGPSLFCEQYKCGCIGLPERWVGHLQPEVITRDLHFWDQLRTK